MVFQKEFWNTTSSTGICDIKKVVKMTMEKSIQLNIFEYKEGETMDFDLTTPNNAYSFLLETLCISGSDFIKEYAINSSSNFDLFWKRNYKKLNAIDIRNMHFIAFHVVGSLDGCQEIQQLGIRNLQYVLNNNTKMAHLLSRCNVKFDIENCKMFYKDKVYNIDYDYYKNLISKSPIEEKLDSIAHRIYYDFCINGFMANDEIEAYGTEIHKRPEFIYTLSKLIPEVKRLDNFWKSKSEPYKVVFYATIDQIHKFNFDLEKNSNEFTEEELTHIKRWVFSNAIDRAFSNISERYIYIRDEVHIPPEQILRCEKIS